jgi:hypothetical protein
MNSNYSSNHSVSKMLLKGFDPNIWWNNQSNKLYGTDMIEIKYSQIPNGPQEDKSYYGYGNLWYKERNYFIKHNNSVKKVQDSKRFINAAILWILKDEDIFKDSVVFVEMMKELNFVDEISFSDEPYEENKRLIESEYWKIKSAIDTYNKYILKVDSLISIVSDLKLK